MASQGNARLPGPIPARAGIGLRALHQHELATALPDVGWLEAHSENYFADGGAQIECLAVLCERYPLSLHGVGLSLGSTDRLDGGHLRQLKRLVDWSRPVLVSEHLSWSSVGGVHANDLLPLPYTEEALAHLTQRLTQVQDALGRQLLVENISSYLRYRDEQLSEPEFLARLAAETGCGILLDVNNVYVSAANHGFDARDYIARIPAAAVQEIHLAGHSENGYGRRRILIDTHSARVADAVWDLYAFALERLGPVATIIEWDASLPPLAVLLEEAAIADRHLVQAHALAA